MPTREHIQWVMDNLGASAQEAPSLAAWIENGGQYQGINQFPPTLNHEGMDARDRPGPQLPQIPDGDMDDTPTFARPGQDPNSDQAKQFHLEQLAKIHEQRRKQIEAQMYDIFGLMNPDLAQSYNPNPSPQTPLITNPPLQSIGEGHMPNFIPPKPQ